MERTSIWARAAGVAAGVVLAAGLAACGDSSGDEPDRGAASPTAQEDVERGIQEALDELRRDFAARDPKAICSRLTERGRRETASSVAGGAPTCEQSVATLLDAYGDALHQEVTVLKVRVAGDRATASLSSDTGNRYPSRFARQDDRWRLDQSLAPDTN